MFPIPLRDTQPSYSKPLITILLIAVNVLAFLFEMSLDPYSRNHFIAVYGIVPDRLNLETLLTSMFMHGGWMHLLGNMWFLWIFGDNIEDDLGHFRYLIFYLVVGIGASGAISGVLGAYLLLHPRRQVRVILFRILTVVPGYVAVGIWFGFQVLS